MLAYFSLRVTTQERRALQDRAVAVAAGPLALARTTLIGATNSMRTARGFFRSGTQVRWLILSLSMRRCPWRSIQRPFKQTTRMHASRLRTSGLQAFRRPLKNDNQYAVKLCMCSVRLSVPATPLRTIACETMGLRRCSRCERHAATATVSESKQNLWIMNLSHYCSGGEHVLQNSGADRRDAQVCWPAWSGVILSTAFTKASLLPVIAA